MQNSQFQQTQANLAPWKDAGTRTLQQIVAGLQPGGDLVTPYSGTFQAPNNPNPSTFTPPTLEQAEQTPGYQFAQQQGDLGILTGATAAGGAFNTGTLKSLAAYNNNLAQNAYQQTYNNSLTGFNTNVNAYQQAYNNALNSFQTQYNTYNTNQSNQYNRLASVSGLGQTTAQQLGQIGASTSANIGNTLTSGAAAGAAGTVGAANAISGGISNTLNSVGSTLTLQQILAGQGYGAGTQAPAYNPTGATYQTQQSVDQNYLNSVDKGTAPDTGSGV